MVHKKVAVVKKYGVQFTAVIIATLGMFSDGMSFAWPSPAVPKLLEPDSPVPMTKEESNWISQLYIFGNIAGVIMSMFIFNKLSRKMSIFIASLPVLLGWLGLLLGRSLWVLYVARFLGGIGRNMIYVTVPMYIGEIADPSIRGILGTMMYIQMNLGVLLVYCITPFFPLYISSTIGIVVVALHILLLFFLPESPYYLLKVGKTEAARKTMQKLGATSDVDGDIKRLTEALAKTPEESKRASFMNLFKVRSNLKALLILLMLRGFQMFSGVSVITMHVHTIFQEVSGTLTTEFSAIIYGLVMLLSCFLTMTVMDRFGRKPLMIFSAFASGLTLGCQGVFFYMQSEYNLSSISWLPVLITVAYVLGYRVGLGTVPIVMVGELFPTEVKVQGVVLTDLMYSISSSVANWVFQITDDNYGTFAPMLIFAGACFVCVVTSALFVPETRAKNLEEIQLMLKNKGDKLNVDEKGKEADLITRC